MAALNSMLAEAAHSWADAGNGVFLLIATGGRDGARTTRIPTFMVGYVVLAVLLGVFAIVLINRNRRFLVGEEAHPRVRAAALQALLDEPEIARVTYLRLEVVGPRMVSVIGDVDLTGEDTESHVAVRLRALEAKIAHHPQWPAPSSVSPPATSRR